MKAIEILQSPATSLFFARMEDGSFRWLTDSMRLGFGGPQSSWVERGLTAHSVSWGGPSIQRPLCHDILLGSLNRNIA
jgi:hypothetical protein